MIKSRFQKVFPVRTIVVPMIELAISFPIQVLQRSKESLLPLECVALTVKSKPC